MSLGYGQVDNCSAALRSCPLAHSLYYDCCNDCCAATLTDRRRRYLNQGRSRVLTNPSTSEDQTHPKPFVQGKDLTRWIPHRVWYLEWGTERAPDRFSRPTFSELHGAKEKLIAVRTPGSVPKVIYDNKRIHFDASSVGFVSWHQLAGVVNRSIDKTARYRYQDPSGDRDERERLSQQFHAKYLLAIMNSAFAREWLSRRRRSKMHVYPDNWKQLPIAPIPSTEQEVFVRQVDAILTEFAAHGYPLPAESAARVAEIEREIDPRVARLYEAKDNV